MPVHQNSAGASTAGLSTLQKPDGAGSSGSATEPAGTDQFRAPAPRPPARSTVGATASPQPRQAEVRHLLGLSVPMAVMLAARQMPIESILTLTVGSIIEFDTPSDSELTLQAANRSIGRGQAVKVGENFGLRITQIDNVPERIDALGRH